MKRVLILVAVSICMVLSQVCVAGPLIWRGAKTLKKGQFITMGSFTYKQLSRGYDWSQEEWIDIDENKVNSVSEHLMLGYGLTDNLEGILHLPFLQKWNDDDSSGGLQDMILKFRYGFPKVSTYMPALTLVGSLRLPSSDHLGNLPIDDGTVDVGLGAIITTNRHGFFRAHLKGNYWINGTKDGAISIASDGTETETPGMNMGDEIEALIKLDFFFYKKNFFFLNFNYLQRLQNRTAGDIAIDNSQIQRFSIIPGIVVKQIKGLSIRPKVKVAMPFASKGGKNITAMPGLDIWYVF